MANNDSKWIVWNAANRSFMKHPRGEWTYKWEEAYCWAYKRDAGAECRGVAYRVNKLGDVKRLLGM